MRRARTTVRTWSAPLFCLITACASAAEQAPQVAAQSSAALLEKLEAIRSALVDAAIGKQAQVRSVLWVDENGQLHENTQVTSEMRVRAIRVHPAGSNASEPKVSVDILPAAMRQQGCAAASTNLLLPVIIETDFQPGGVLVSNQITLAQIAKLFEGLLLQQQPAGTRWDLKAAQRATPYAQWVSNGSIQSAPYRLKLTIGVPSGHTASRRRFPFLEESMAAFEKDEPAPIILNATLMENATGRVHWHDSAVLPGFTDVPQMTRPSPPAAWIASASQIAASILSQSFHSISCDAAFFDVLPLGQNEYAVNAGRKSGLRVGDQMLIATPGLFPKKILQKGGIEQTYIGEIREVSSEYSRIRILGTSALPGQAANLVAFPL